jgi:molecular chaperone DnaK
MNEFKDQLDATEKDKVTTLLTELRAIAVKGQAADPSITAEAIREKINETQQASLFLFQKVVPYFVPVLNPKLKLSYLQVYEKRSAENNPSEQPSESEEKTEEKKEEKKD